MPRHVLRARPSATGRARQHVRSELSPILSASKVTDAELMTTELVSNAIRHAGLPEGDSIGLEFSVELETVRVAVVDAGSGFASAPPATEEGIGGWGLVLIERLSDRWGVHSAHPHSVWFEIER